MAVQIVTVTGKHVHNEEKSRNASLSSVKRAIAPAKKLATARLNARLLVAGNLMSWGFDGIAFAEGEEPAALWPGVAEAKCRICRAERLLGFVTTLRDGDTAIAYDIGFDRAAAAEGLPIYLRLLHATIADAISWGCKSLSLGRTALEPKAALGAKPEPMSVWLRHRVPAMNWIIRGMLGAVTHEKAPERNPFKAISGAKVS